MKNLPKKLTLELIPDRELGGFTARIPDIPAHGEGKTEKAAVSDLQEALAGYVAEFGIEDALARVNAPVRLEEVTVSLADFARA